MFKLSTASNYLLSRCNDMTPACQKDVMETPVATPKLIK